MNITVLPQGKEPRADEVAELVSHAMVIVFILTSLGLGVALKLLSSVTGLLFAYYPAMLLLGFAIGKVLDHFPGPFDKMIVLLENANANTFLLLFLPVILFQTAFSMDYHGFGHSTGQVLLLATVGFPLQLLFLTVITHGALAEKRIWDYEVSIIFSIICLIIESETVLEELNKTQARVKHVQLLLQGEQLATLAMAELSYCITFEYFYGTHDSGTFVIILILYHICGLIVGSIFGYILGYVFVHTSNDMVIAVSLTAFAAAFSFYIGHILLNHAGVIFTIVTGVLLSPAKIKSTLDIESHLTIFWDWLAFVCCSMANLIPGVMVGKQPDYLTPYNMLFTIVVFILCGCARTLLFVLSRPLLLRVGHSLSWTNITVVVSGPYRSAPALIFAMLYRQYNPELGHEVLTKIVMLCFISSLINGIILPSLLKLLGMYDLTHARAMNLKNAIAHVHECRKKAIHSLKMDRIVADANWLVVDNTTHISKQNTFVKEGLSKLSGYDEVGESHTAVCSDCGLVSPVVPTEKELSDLEAEGKHRILKAQLVSMWRQYESGTLTKRSIRILSTILQNAMEKPDPKLNVNELEFYWSPPTYMRRFKLFIEYLLRILPKKYEHGPPQKIKGALFRINNMMACKMFTSLLVLLDTYFILNLCLHNYWPKKSSIPMYDLQIVDFIFYGIFLSEFFFLIWVLGIYEYFRRSINKIDFICNVLIRTCEVEMVIELYVNHGTDTNLLNGTSNTIQVLKFLLLFRLLRLCTLTEFVIWKILQSLETRIDRSLVQYYDICKAFLIANDRTLKYLRHIVHDKIVYTKLRRDLEEDRKRVAKSVGIVHKERPNVAVTMKTHHAIKHVVNEMVASINSIYDEGLLDEIERKFLSLSLENTKRSIRSLGVIPPCSPEQILREVPWLYEEAEVANYLLSHAKLQSYFYGDTIIGAGDEPYGIFVLVSGLVKCIYKPARSTIENCRKHGALPNCDFRVSLKLEESEEEYVVCGNVIGEIGAVTGRTYDMIVICQSVVQVYYIPWPYMWNALFEIDSSFDLYCRVWKCIGIRIALLILQYIPIFQGWLREKTLFYLERSFVPTLSGVEEITLNDTISDVILIEGMVMDGHTRSMFFAPYYIPRTTNRLIMPGTSRWSIEPKYETRLLIIPSEHAEENEIMGPGGIIKGVERGRSSGPRAGRKTLSTSSFGRKDSVRFSEERMKFHQEVMRQLLSQPTEAAESTESFSTDSDIPLMKIFQKHVRTAVKGKPEHRINLQNEFNIIEDVLEQSDEKAEEEMADYHQYGHLLKKKIKKKIMKKKKNQLDVQTQTVRTVSKDIL